MNQMARPALPRMTAVEFFDRLADGSVRDCELVDGVLRPMTPPSWVHGVMMATLIYEIRTGIDAAGLPLQVVGESGLMPGDAPELNVRIPDILVTSGPARKGVRQVEGAVLLVEILSPSNRRETRDNVRLYQATASVQEIVVIDSERVRSEVLARGSDGAWPAAPVIAGPGGRLRLASVALDLPIERAYAGTWLAEAPGAA